MNIIEFFDFVNIFLAVFLSALVFGRDPTSKLNRIFVVSTLVSGFSAFCEYLRLSSGNLSWALFWLKASCLWMFFPFIFYQFVLVLTTNKYLSNKILNLAFLLPAVFIFVLHLFTNLLYKGIVHYWYGWNFVESENIFGQFIGLVFISTGLFSLILTYRYYIKLTNVKKKKQALSVILGLAIPLLGSSITQGILPNLGIETLPLNSIFFIIGTTFLSISILKYKTFLVKPLDVLKKLFASTRDYVIVFNDNKEILLSSNSFEKITCLKEEEIVGYKLNKFFKYGTTTSNINISDLVEREVEMNFETGRNEDIPISATISLIQSDVKNEKLYLLLGRDLRERKQSEEDLIKLQKELEYNVEKRTAELEKTNIDLQIEIRERKSIEAALIESEERYRNLFENSPIGIYRTTPDGKILISNPAVVKMLGYESFKELAQNNLEIEKYSGQENSRSEYKKIIERDGKVTGFIAKWQKKDGQEIYVRENAKCNYDEGGKPLYYEGTAEDISNQISALNSLKESEEKFRSLVENINEIYYVADSLGRIVYVSPNISSFTGYKAEEWIGSHAFKFVYENDIHRVIKFYIDNRKDKTLDASIEFRSMKRNGSIFWVEQITRFARDEKGNVVEYRNVTRDVTERKIAEEKLMLLAKAVESTGEGISITDLNNNILFVNKAFKDIYGYNDEELIGQNIKLVRSENNPDHLIENIGISTLSSGWFGKLINKKKNGIEFPILLSTSSVYNDKGEPFALVGITRDITEQSIAEKELEEYRNQLEELVEERTKKLDDVNKQLKKEIEKQKLAESQIQDQLTFLQALLDTIPNPIFIRDWKKHYTGCNKAFEAFHGVRREDIIGKTIFDVLPRQIVKYVDEKDDLLLETTNEQNYETKAYDSHGGVHDVIVYKAPFKKADETLAGMVGIILDITEIKKLQSKILNTLVKEKELNELKSKFISVASHEFRTPLTSILASADLLEMYGRKWTEEKYSVYIKNIQNAVEYMNELINDVSFVNKSDSDKIKLRPEEGNLYELAKSIFDNIKISASKDTKLIFEYNIDQKVFKIDGKLITQILTNLLSNAVKYSPDGGSVILTIGKEDDFILLEVSDNGIGIAEEDQKNLFEPFHRGINVGTIQGTGLGLSIIKKSAELHGGRLEVQSKLNEGTKVKVLLNCER